MSTASIGTSVSGSKFSYYTLEKKSELINFTKRIACAVANIFIGIGNFFYECFFTKKKIEVSPPIDIPSSPVPDKPLVKPIAVEPIDPNISSPRTWVNAKGKTVCDEVTYLPCVSENPLKRVMTTLKQEGDVLERAAEEYASGVDSILPKDFDKHNPGMQLTPEEVLLFKNYQLSQIINSYIEAFKAERNREPTKEELAQAYSEEIIAEIFLAVENHLKKATGNQVEDLKKFIKTLGESKPTLLNNLMTTTLGLVAGAACVYFGSQLGTYLGDKGSELLLSIKDYNQTNLIGSMSAVALTGLQGAAFLRRGYNWGKIALAGSIMAAKVLTPSSGESRLSLKALGKAGAALVGGYITVPIIYRGMKDYYDHQELAIGNESKYVIRDYFGIGLMDRFKNYALEKVLEAELPSRKVFEKAYGVAKQSTMGYLFATTVLGLGSMTAGSLALATAFFL